MRDSSCSNNSTRCVCARNNNRVKDVLLDVRTIRGSGDDDDDSQLRIFAKKTIYFVYLFVFDFSKHDNTARAPDRTLSRVFVSARVR